MRTISTSCQTEQFLGLLLYEDKLTKLYQRIKIAQALELQHLSKIEYLEYKNAALEKSLFQYELKSRDKQATRNEVLLHDLISLQEEIVKEKNQVKNMAKCERKSSLESKNRRTVKDEDTPNNSLITIKQQPDLQNPPPTSKRQKQSKGETTQSRKQTRRPLQQLDQNGQTEKVSFLEQQVQKQQKNRRIMEIEIKRLRKLNDEYSSKCKKLEKMIDAKSQLYGNLSMQLNENCFNQPNFSAFLGLDDPDAGVLFH